MAVARRIAGIAGLAGRMALAGLFLAWAGIAGAQALTSPTLIQRSYPEAEAALQRVAGAWQASQSVRYTCELEYILKGTNTEKRDRFRVDLRAMLPRHIAVKAYTNGSVMAVVYDGEFVFTHSKGNRFSKAPLTGDLGTLLATGRLASYPMVLIEMFAAVSPAAYLNHFDSARVTRGARDGDTTLILTRRRETITITLTKHGDWLMPAKVEHQWTFDPEVLEQTDKNLQLQAFETYTSVDTAQPIPIDEMNVQSVALELMKELGLMPPDEATTATLPAATPAATPERVKVMRERIESDAAGKQMAPELSEPTSAPAPTDR